MSRRVDDFHRHSAQVDHFAVRQKARRTPGTVIELFDHDLFPIVPFLGPGHAVIIHKDIEIADGRRILFGNPDGPVIEQVQVGHVIFMVMGKPDRIHARIIQKPAQKVAVRGRVDQHFLIRIDEKGMTKRISAGFPTGNEIQRPPIELLHNLPSSSLGGI